VEMIFKRGDDAFQQSEKDANLSTPIPIPSSRQELDKGFDTIPEEAPCCHFDPLYRSTITDRGSFEGIFFGLQGHFNSLFNLVRS
jgi:hypothetical protein